MSCDLFISPTPPLLKLTNTPLLRFQMERTFIAIKPDGVQRGLVSTSNCPNTIVSFLQMQFWILITSMHVCCHNW